MSTTTTYYEFIKPEGTDLVNPLVDTNPNWDALDADLHEFNERSIANCTEIVTLGVHAISRLDTTAKFLKWIATANFTAGETFTVDGLAVAASTPAGATLATGAYVTGSVVLACLNADNTAMTVFVSGTTVASDAERLGGQLPAYYATQSDMTTAENNISNLQSKMGNTSIVGIGDGTATGAISAINADLDNLKTYSSNEVAIGKWIDGKTIYRKSGFVSGSVATNQVILDATLTRTYVDKLINCSASMRTASGDIIYGGSYSYNDPRFWLAINNSGLIKGDASQSGNSDLVWTVEYTKA